MKVAVIIPCYNEEKSVGLVIDELEQLKKNLGHQLDIVIVNDCSLDSTREVVMKRDCVLLDLPVNLGIGGAVQCGFRYAFNNGYDVAIQLDGDGQHPAGEIPKLLQPMTSGEADVVIGSRFLDKEGFQSTYLRRLGIQYFKWLNRFISGVTIHDSTSGFRAINTKTLEVVSRYYPDTYPEAEAVVLYTLNHLRIKEVPVVMRERQGGVSSIRSLSSFYYMFKVTLGIIFVYIRLINNNGKRSPL
jgi:glycosyltransferase involved in cell wall biosynthesis